MRATCSKCGTEKDASEFSVRPSGTLQSHCKDCKNEFNPTDTAYQGAYVDHCHETGVVRGLLCHNCNFAIGYMKDNPQRLRAAANYLEVTLSTT